MLYEIRNIASVEIDRDINEHRVEDIILIYANLAVHVWSNILVKLLVHIFLYGFWINYREDFVLLVSSVLKQCCWNEDSFFNVESEVAD